MAKKSDRKKLPGSLPPLDIELVTLYAKLEWEKGRAERQSTLQALFFGKQPPGSSESQTLSRFTRGCISLLQHWLETLYQLCARAWEKNSTYKTSQFFDDALAKVIRPEIDRAADFVRKVISEATGLEDSAVAKHVVWRSYDFVPQLLEKWNLQIEIEKREYEIEHAALRQGQSEGAFPTPPQKRASDVARIIKELDILKPNMLGAKSDYEKLRDSHNEFLTFEVASKHPELEVKVINLQGHRRHIRLAQELTAAYHGRALETVQSDWKKFKPREYRTKNS